MIQPFLSKMIPEPTPSVGIWENGSLADGATPVEVIVTIAGDTLAAAATMAEFSSIEIGCRTEVCCPPVASAAVGCAGVFDSDERTRPYVPADASTAERIEVATIAAIRRRPVGGRDGAEIGALATPVGPTGGSNQRSGVRAESAAGSEAAQLGRRSLAGE